jgi:hypothetical protein
MVSNKYLIIPVTELDKVDFSQLVITSKDTLRYSIDGLKTFIEWDDVEPTFLDQLSGTQGAFTADEISAVLSNPEWQSKEILNEHQESILSDNGSIPISLGSE